MLRSTLLAVLLTISRILVLWNATAELPVQVLPPRTQLNKQRIPKDEVRRGTAT